MNTKPKLNNIIELEEAEEYVLDLEDPGISLTELEDSFEDYDEILDELDTYYEIDPLAGDDQYTAMSGNEFDLLIGLGE